MALYDWSTNAASNESVGSIDFSENMAPNIVNDSSRALMADVRMFYNNIEWRDWGHTPVRTGDTTFTISSASDLSSIYTVGRRLKCTDSSTLYATITASSYAASTQTVTVSVDGGTALSASLSAVALGPDPTNKPIGNIQGVANSVNGDTSAEYTGIPSWVTRIVVNIAGLTTNGTVVPKIQIGYSGGFEATGYVGSVITLLSIGTSTDNLSTGFNLSVAWEAASVANGSYTLTLLQGSTNTWVIDGGVGYSNAAAISNTRGFKNLTGTLDRVRVIMDGTDQFDGTGVINIQYS